MPMSSPSTVAEARWMVSRSGWVSTRPRIGIDGAVAHPSRLAQRTQRRTSRLSDGGVDLEDVLDLEAPPELRQLDGGLGHGARVGGQKAALIAPAETPAMIGKRMCGKCWASPRSTPAW